MIELCQNSWKRSYLGKDANYSKLHVLDAIITSYYDRVLIELSKDEALRKKMGKAGANVVESNRGALSKTIKLLGKYLIK